MKKRRIKNVLIDKLHRGFVYACIGVTLYTTSVLGIKWYQYITEKKPQFERQKLLEKENLLAEGSSQGHLQASS